MSNAQARGGLASDKNDIAQRQNTDRHLQMVQAWKQMYYDYKVGERWWEIASVVVALIGTGIIGWTQPIAGWYVLASLALLVMEGLWFRSLRGRIHNAALVQERFDTEVLDLPWDDALGSPPIKDAEIIEAANRFSHTRAIASESTRDWYKPSTRPDGFLESLPWPQARLECLRQNIEWELYQRNRFQKLMTVILLAEILMLVLLGMLLRLSFLGWIAGPVMLWVAPLYLSAKRMLSEKDSIQQIEGYHRVWSDLWRDAGDPSQDAASIKQRTRALQSSWFYYRAKSLPVPELIYKRLAKHADQHVHGRLST